MHEIWFWQRIVSPHMAGLAASMARLGCRVIYVAEHSMSLDRVALGWQVPDLGGAQLRFVPDAAAVAALVDTAESSSVHICQGIRANGGVGIAQRLLAQRGLRQWVVMETVDDAGFVGQIKRRVYSMLLRLRRCWYEGVLATGYTTAEWVVARGMPQERVFSFAYFLPDPAQSGTEDATQGLFRFIFVGQLIERKRVAMLLTALSRLELHSFQLDIIGVGPLEVELRQMADDLLPGCVRWLGRLPSTEVPSVIEQADCLVLPSRHDGWGAVVSEALMVGTPAICSNACGSADVVRASEMGGVFPNGDVTALSSLLLKALDSGRVDRDTRQRLAHWGRCLGAEAGAKYLLDILAHCDGAGERPSEPWDAKAATGSSRAMASVTQIPS